MKKILAVLLAVIMAFSLGVVGFAAEVKPEDNPGLLLPTFPTQKEGAIFIACDNTYIAPGQTYEIPVYLISDYTPSVESGTAILGFKIYLGGAPVDGEVPQINITAITPSPEVQALADYELVGCGVNIYDFGVNENQFSFTTTDLSIFKQAKFPLATVTVEVTDAYIGSTTEEVDGEDVRVPVDCYLYVSPAEHYLFYETDYANYCLSPMAIIDTENCYEIESIVADGANGPVFISSGHLIEEPPKESWQDKLKDWAINLLSVILDKLGSFFETLNIVLPDIV